MIKVAGGQPGQCRTVLSVQPMAERGGSDQALLTLTGQLTTAGWTVHLALPGTSPMADDFASAGAHLHVVPMRRISTSHDLAAWAGYLLNWPITVVRLWRLARRVHADVLHSNSLHSWYGWAAAVLARRPHVWHAREIVTQSRAALGVERFLARYFACEVLAASGAIAQQLHPGNVRVVYEEADPARFFPGRAGLARQRAGLADDALVVGYVGRIDTWKGIDVLLDALPQLRARRPGLEAVIAGGTVRDKEGYAKDLAKKATTLGVHWLGPQSGTEAGDLIADLDCLSYPSTLPEPWGLVIVEALACGTPVVASDAGGPREILADLPPDAGILVAPGDAAALAAAIDFLLPAKTSTEQRRQRRALRKGSPPRYPELFEAAASARAGHPRGQQHPTVQQRGADNGSIST
jgi:glycosyltransferase involved in cell wall biosynthesis